MLSATERSIQGRIGEPTATDDSRARGAAAFQLLMRQLHLINKKTPTPGMESTPMSPVQEDSNATPNDSC